MEMSRFRTANIFIKWAEFLILFTSVKYVAISFVALIVQESGIGLVCKKIL